MPLVFLNFPYPAMKNLVDQMSKTDLVRISLQSPEAIMALRECGKTNVSFYNLDASEIEELSEFDKAELFFSEAERQGNFAEWDVELWAEVSEKFSVNLSNDDKNFYVSIKIDSIENIDGYVGDRKNLKIRGTSVPIIITEDKKLVSFWDNKVDGLIFVLQYFAERFGMTIDELILRKDDSPNYSDNLRRIVSACSQLSIKKVYVGYGNDKDKRKVSLSAEDYKFVMENLTATGTFRALSKSSKKFKFDRAIKAKSIFIENGHWFKIKHLLEWDDYEKLEVKGKNFTAKELRKFLEKWVAGGFPKLKELTLESKEMYHKVTDGFEKRTDIRQTRPCRNWFTLIKGPGGSYATVWSPPSTPAFNMYVKYRAFRKNSH
ncbi:unnamed protein product [Caenorhabditis brenneri]